MQYQTDPEGFVSAVTEQRGGDAAQEVVDRLPSFFRDYQPWYSEAKALIRQLLPDRLADFARLYERPRAARKELTLENYTIEDALMRLTIPGLEIGPGSALTNVQQQLHMVRSIEARLQSSLFDIRQLTQADLFDSELDAARELLRSNFLRAAGTVGGVVLERHLKEVCTRQGIPIRKQRPQIADLNDALKNAGALDMSQWRFHQHLGDLRNLCAHDANTEPTKEQVKDLLTGVDKVIKTVF